MPHKDSFLLWKLNDSLKAVLKKQHQSIQPESQSEEAWEYQTPMKITRVYLK